MISLQQDFARNVECLDKILPQNFAHHVVSRLIFNNYYHHY
jgi:hypothetical protein